MVIAVPVSLLNLEGFMQSLTNALKRWRVIPLWILDQCQKNPLLPRIYLIGFTLTVILVTAVPAAVNWYTNATFVPPPPPVSYPTTQPAQPNYAQPAPNTLPSSAAVEVVSQTHARLDGNTITVTWSKNFSLQSMFLDGNPVSPTCAAFTCTLNVTHKPQQLEVRWIEEEKPMRKLYSFQDVI